MDPDQPLRALGGLTPEAFLRDYWGKKPLVVRGAFPDAAAVITPDALKKLATREEAVSRLVLEAGGAYPWELRHGPFRARDFRGLPPAKWSLLVQEVDRFVPAARALLDPFAFVPRWRLDDVMVSYAPPEGGVGAHVDNYDVFLLQGMGRRRWRIGNAPVLPEGERLVDGLDVAVLADFAWTDEHVLEPGDMLYLPPRVAHEGLALDACLTLSIGFRAPSHAEIVGGYLEHALAALPDGAFYADADLAPTERPGEIDARALEQVRGVLRAALTDDEAIRGWFGTYVTERRRDVEPDDDAPAPATPDAVAAHVGAGRALRHAPGARVAYVRHDGETTLFARGQAYRLEPELAFAASLLADRTSVSAADLAHHLPTPDFADLVAALVADGALVWG